MTNANFPPISEMQIPPNPQAWSEPAQPVTVNNLSHFSPTFGQLAGALAAAQATMEQPQKTKTARITFGARNGGTGKEKTYKYCDIADILKAALPHLGKNGLAFMQRSLPSRSEKFTVYDAQGVPQEITRLVVGVSTILVHSSGEWAENIIEATGDGMAPQALASIITYLRRIGGQMIIGIAGDSDDDGEEGQGDQEGGASGNPGSTAPTGPRRASEGVTPSNGSWEVVDTVEETQNRDLGGGRMQYGIRFKNAGWASTMAKPLAEKIGRETGTGLAIRMVVKKAANGKGLDIVSGDVIPPSAQPNTTA